MDKIHFILTGGTIDSYYEPSKDTVIPSKTSDIPRFLKSLKLYVDFEFTTVCMKDSRSLSRADREKIKRTIEKSKCKRIIVTHGTYTVPDTAKYLEANLKAKGKVIVLVGSMIPLMGFAPSDAPFTLGYAIAQTEILKSGVYVCMNARVFRPGEVVKELSEGKFSSVFGER